MSVSLPLFGQTGNPIPILHSIGSTRSYLTRCLKQTAMFVPLQMGYFELSAHMKMGFKTVFYIKKITHFTFKSLNWAKPVS